MERTLRIYIAIPTFFPLVGGAEKQTHAQCQRFLEKGCEPTIVTFRHDRSWLPCEAIGGVPVLRVAGLLLAGREKLPRPLQRLLYVLATFDMARVFWQHRHRYDVLHVVHFSLLVFPLTLLCWLAGKPIVIAMRSVSPSPEAGLYNNRSLVAGPLDATTPWLQVNGIVRYTGDLENFEQWGNLVTRFTRWLLDRTRARIVVLSTRMKDYLAEHNLRLSHVDLIPNGVDILQFSPGGSDSSQAERDQVVVCISRLSHEKGIDVLLQAWHLVHKQFAQAKLIIVGKGSLQAQLGRMAQALEISSSVDFAGFQSDIPSQLHRGSISVLPSHWEGMPNALLEAMACGLACVATRVSGSEDIIEHGINGLLVEPGDYEGMANAIFTLLRDPHLVKTLGQAARLRIEQEYSLAHITDMYIELYQRIAGRRTQTEEQREYLPI